MIPQEEAETDKWIDSLTDHELTALLCLLICKEGEIDMETDEVSIVGLDKAEVLAALYNNSRPQGMGFANYDANPMSREEAAELLAQDHYFDYVKGRVMKIDLASNESFSPGLYDRDNGPGAAAKIIEELRRGKAGAL